MTATLRRQNGVSTSTLLIALVVVAAGAYVAFSAVCPCTRMPGGYLFGETVSEPVTDWSFANQVPLCQVEVRGILPHSINLNCMASDGELYLSCASCAGKRWSTLALAEPNARLRVGGEVYPVTLSKVDDAVVLDRAWAARAAKTARGQETPRAEDWWSFRAESR